MDSVEAPTCERPHVDLETSHELIRLMARASQAREEIAKVGARLAFIEESLELIARRFAVRR